MSAQRLRAADATFRVLIESLLNSLKNLLVLPASDPALLASCALKSDGASPADIDPVTTGTKGHPFSSLVKW